MQDIVKGSETFYSLLTKDKVIRVKNFNYQDKNYLFLGGIEGFLYLFVHAEKQKIMQTYSNIESHTSTVNIPRQGLIEDIFYNHFGKIAVCTNKSVLFFSIDDVFKDTVPCKQEEIAETHEFCAEGLISYKTLACIAYKNANKRHDLFLYDIYNSSCKHIENDIFGDSHETPRFFFGEEQIIRYDRGDIKIYEIKENGTSYNAHTFKLALSPPTAFCKNIIPLCGKIYLLQIKSNHGYYKMVKISGQSLSPQRTFNVVIPDSQSIDIDALQGLQQSNAPTSGLYFLGGMYFIIKNMSNIFFLKITS